MPKRLYVLNERDRRVFHEMADSYFGHRSPGGRQRFYRRRRTPAPARRGSAGTVEIKHGIITADFTGATWDKVTRQLTAATVTIHEMDLTYKLKYQEGSLTMEPVEFTATYLSQDNITIPPPTDDMTNNDEAYAYLVTVIGGEVVWIDCKPIIYNTIAPTS